MAKITSNNLDRDKVEGVKTRDLSDAQLQEFAQFDAVLFTTPVVKTGGTRISRKGQPLTYDKAHQSPLALGVFLTVYKRLHLVEPDLDVRVLRAKIFQDLGQDARRIGSHARNVQPTSSSTDDLLGMLSPGLRAREGTTRVLKKDHPGIG